MKHVLLLIEQKKREIAAHPFYRWMASGPTPLETRFDFAPVIVNFIMAFSDMNRWFMRYPDPSSDLERAINQHTREDETHARLFLEDWRRLGLDRRLGWRASDMIAWYYAGSETDIFREYGTEIMRMCTLNEDPLVRFAVMQSIEAWGHVFFTASAGTAAELTRRSGVEYRYFGPYHLKREIGHLLHGSHLFEHAELDGDRRARACALVSRLFDMIRVKSDRLLRYAERTVDQGEPPPAARTPAAAARAPKQRPGSGAGGLVRRRDERVGASQEPVQRVLERRKRAAAGHALFTWMRARGPLNPEEKLRRIALYWMPDCMGYRDLNVHALAYRQPASRYERAINRWVADLQSHHGLFLRDWIELDMDRRLGWSASDTLEFYCASRHSEAQRQSMAAFLKLAFSHPEPVLRFWLMEALEASGEAFFQNTRALARRVEAEHPRQLDYLADRHALSHPTLDPDEEADAVAFKAEALDERGREIAVGMIHTVFDCLERQFSLSLDLATSAAPPLA
ncbi:hypothetical protein SOCEGT47_070590 [Sorangium cellulosum]|uniref:Uncharacterized protein n=1 Tax=Sorangium cellulosum TaxID=56 RepID=A0A4P2QA41_SORCE|nr:hypothetical protein [Sorangium cellulosum]AUX26490.1 hypothetical protein SOCEGT47_070590 [Sorangium cellulosum]